MRFELLTAALLLFASSAHARDRWDKPVAVHAILGLGTPVGYAGAMVEYSPHPVVAIGAGAGLGGGTENTDCLASGVAGVCDGPLSDRVQLAAMARFRVMRWEELAFTVGAGASGGGYSWDEFTTDEPAHKSADLAYWGNLELGVEYRAESGFTARGFSGFAHMLNPSALECIDTGINSDHCPNDHVHSGENVVYLGGSVGWAF